MRHRNVIGPQVRKLRYRHRWSQNICDQVPALRLERLTRNRSKDRVASSHVLDVQVLYLAEVLQVPVGALFPRTQVRRRPIERVLIARIFTFQSNFVPHAEQTFPKPCNNRARNSEKDHEHTARCHEWNREIEKQREKGGKGHDERQVEKILSTVRLTKSLVLWQ
jgi:hypothetical protein